MGKRGRAQGKKKEKKTRAFRQEDKDGKPPEDLPEFHKPIKD